MKFKSKLFIFFVDLRNFLLSFEIISVRQTPQSGVPPCWLADAVVRRRPLFVVVLALDDLVQLVQFLVLVW